MKAFAIRVYIPSVHQDSIDTVANRLADFFGGATTYQGNGRWFADDGNLISEHVTVVESVAQVKENATDRHDAIEDNGVMDKDHAICMAHGNARNVKSRTDENSVMWEVRKTNVGFE